MAEIEVERVHDVNTYATTAGYGRGFRRRDISWGAIFAGAVIAVATMLLLSLLGAAIGLMSVQPNLDSLQTTGIASAVWYVVSKLIALFVGGYAAARLSANLDGQRAMLHGATVWALAAIGSALLAASAIGNAFGALGSAVSSTASVAGSAVQAVIPEDIDLPNFTSSDAAIDALPPRLQRAIRDQGLTAEQLRSETRAAFRDVISRDEQRRIQSLATNTAVDIIRTPGDAVEDFNSAIDRLVGQGGIISSEDRNELEVAISERLGLTRAESRELVNRYQREAQQAADRVRAEAAELRAEAASAAEEAADTAGQTALWAFFALLAGLIAAVVGAAMGRRDEPMVDTDRTVVT